MSEPTYEPWVVCAANRHKETGLIVCGARHYDSVMRAVMAQLGGWPFWNHCDQGFIDQRGNFLTREEAWVIAEKNGQIIKKVSRDGILYSECLY